MDKKQRKLIWLELYISGKMKIENLGDQRLAEYIPCENIRCPICDFLFKCGNSARISITKDELDELLEEYPELKVII